MESIQGPGVLGGNAAESQLRVPPEKHNTTGGATFCFPGTKTTDKKNAHQGHHLPYIGNRALKNKEKRSGGRYNTGVGSKTRTER